MKLDQLLDYLWNDYLTLTPLANKVHQIIESRGDRVVNDHIALRTFAASGVGLSEFCDYFLGLGYQRVEDYSFDEKKLNATHLEHFSNAQMPKIFISELRYYELSDEVSSIIKREIERIKMRTIEELLSVKNVFSVSAQEYKLLYKESEYAAWLCAHGFRANHFTVLVNNLESLKDLEELNSLLIENNIPLNTAGGLIKGSPDEYLEQSSTMAEKRKVSFSDCDLTIPTCYYEFALRYTLPDGNLFQGFVAKSADKIFESTNE